jgi:hypothetical protein
MVSTESESLDLEFNTPLAPMTQKLDFQHSNVVVDKFPMNMTNGQK